ncbi:hypothetical protein GCM10017559_47370 [Streptosporangium longisporum]|uniref:Uncharacterized protein n=1 Tax=Streptosporangium longisporum TaxID=46187 RepID=A0ABP6KQI1_9ACTN
MEVWTLVRTFRRVPGERSPLTGTRGCAGGRARSGWILSAVPARVDPVTGPGPARASGGTVTVARPAEGPG